QTSSVVEGLTVAFEAEVTDREGQSHEGRAVIWSSDDEDVAVVNQSGVATALEPGRVTIRARLDDAEGTAELIVEDGPSVEIDPAAVALSAGVGSGPLEPVTLEVRNDGAGDLGSLSLAVEHPAGESDGWLEAELGGDDVPTTLRLSADPGDLRAGEHRASVIVTASAPDQTPVHVPVTLFLAGFSVDETGEGTSVGEGEGRDTISVALDARPAGQVVLRVASEDEGEVTVDPAELSFGPGDWDEPQVV